MIVNKLYNSLKEFVFPDTSTHELPLSELDKIIASNEHIDKTFGIMEPFGIAISGDSSEVHIASNVYFRRFCNIIVAGGGKLSIGKGAFFNNYCSINCLGEINIGENTLFGEGVKVYDHNHLYNFDGNNLYVDKDNFKIGPVNIGKNCWIGSQVVILPNVTIGDNVIIGANSLIYKSIQSNVIVKHKSEIVISNL